MATETGLKLHRIYSELAKSPHGKLEEYLPIGKEAAKSEPEFLAHLIAWNAKKGDIRDSKVALPLLALDFIVARGQRYGRFREYEENALAHLALLSPRDLLRGWRFANAAKLAGRRHALFNLVKMYLGNLERGPHSAWDRMVVQHRRSLHELYALSHTRPQQVFGNEVRAALFGEDAHGNKLEHRAGSTLDVIARLKDMDPATAAGEVIRRRIPFLIAAPALGAKLKDPAVLSAVIERMSPTELISHMKMLEKLGVKKNPVLRATLEKVMTRLETAKVPVFKIGKALEKTESGGQIEGEELRERLSAIQNKQMDKGSVEGDWLVLADCSGSMESAVRIARMVSGCLSRMAKGRVHLVFFNSLPRYFDVSGKTIEEITAITQQVTASGATSIGCGLDWISKKNIVVDGIAIVSDGGENTPPLFWSAYKRYEQQIGKTIPVYLYRVHGDPNVLTGSSELAGISVTEFDLTGSVDYYSVPNLVTTMRTSVYSLVDEIMDAPLLKVSDVLYHV